MQFGFVVTTGLELDLFQLQPGTRTLDPLPGCLSKLFLLN